MARAIARQVTTNLSSSIETRLAQAPSVKPEAYLEYHRGLGLWNERGQGNLEKSLRHYNKALAIDDSYAEAWSGLADSYSALGYRSYWVCLSMVGQGIGRPIRSLDLPQNGTNSGKPAE